MDFIGWRRSCPRGSPAHSILRPDENHWRRTSISVAELRVRGDELLDKEIVIEGYVTWMYGCIEDVQARTAAVVVDTEHGCTRGSVCDGRQIRVSLSSSGCGAMA